MPANSITAGVRFGARRRHCSDELWNAESGGGAEYGIASERARCQLHAGLMTGVTITAHGPRGIHTRAAAMKFAVGLWKN